LNSIKLSLHNYPEPDLRTIYQECFSMLKSSFYPIDYYSPFSRLFLSRLASNFLKEIIVDVSKDDEKYRKVNDCLKEYSHFHHESCFASIHSTAYEKVFKSVSETIFLLLSVAFPSYSGLVTQFLQTWKDLEKIIYEYEEDYRDHFLHQFNVFLLGCCFLNYFLPLIETIWFETEPEDRSPDEMKLRTFRSWLAASIFHDFANLISKTKHINELFNKAYLTFNNFMKLVFFDVDILFEKQATRSFINIMEAVAEYGEFEYVEDIENFANIYDSDFPFIVNGLKQKDHGVISALLFWYAIRLDLKLGMREIKRLSKEKDKIEPGDESKLQREFKRILILQRLAKEGKVIPIDREKGYQIIEGSLGELLKQMGYNEEHVSRTEYINQIKQWIIENDKLKKAIREDMDISAFAIANHNIKKFKVNFIKYPLTYLLMVCDELQQFGRFKYRKGEIEYNGVELIDLKYYNYGNISEFKGLIATGAISNLHEEVTEYDKWVNNNLNQGIIIIFYEGGDNKFWDRMKLELGKIFSDKLSNGPSFIITKLLESETKFIFAAIKMVNGDYKIYMDN